MNESSASRVECEELWLLSSFRSTSESQVQSSSQLPQETMPRLLRRARLGTGFRPHTALLAGACESLEGVF